MLVDMRSWREYTASARPNAIHSLLCYGNTQTCVPAYELDRVVQGVHEDGPDSVTGRTRAAVGPSNTDHSPVWGPPGRRPCQLLRIALADSASVSLRASSRQPASRLKVFSRALTAGSPSQRAWEAYPAHAARTNARLHGSRAFAARRGRGSSTTQRAIRAPSAPASACDESVSMAIRGFRPMPATYRRAKRRPRPRATRSAWRNVGASFPRRPSNELP